MAEPCITTERLRLTRLRDDDAASLFRYRSNPEVARYQPFAPSSMDDVTAFLARGQSADFDTPGSWFQFGIRKPNSSELIGDLGVHTLASDPRQAELGFSLAPEHQGAGYATEAVNAVLALLFGERDKHRVSASVDPRNSPCVKLLERIGMRREAHFKNSFWLRGEWTDDLVYAMLQDEWRPTET